MTHRIVKPFYDPERRKMLNVGDKFSSKDTTRVAELEGNKMIEKVKAPAPKQAPANKHAPQAPSNKDAANQGRRTK